MLGIKIIYGNFAFGGVISAFRKSGLKMKNFNDYAKNKRAGEFGGEQNERQNGRQGLNSDSRKNGQTGQNGQSEIPAGAFEMLKKFAGKYEGASESEIMQAILAEAKRSRKNGTLSDGEIDEFVNAITPMLDGAQAKKLKAVAEKIKKT